MANKIIWDNKKTKFTSRLFIIGLFVFVTLTEVFRTETQPIWRYGLIVGLMIVIFFVRFLIKKYVEKNKINNQSSGLIA